MDTFIDKLAQKKNAQEMILANMTAEAAKMDQMQNQMKAYDELMQEIRQVNLKTAENLSDVHNTLKEYLDKLDKLEAAQSNADEREENEQSLTQLKELLEEKFRQSDDFLHRENVKVYRNVQAAVAEALEKQTEELKKSQKEHRGSKALLPISILTLIAVLVDVAIHLFEIIAPYINIKLFWF